MSTPKSTANRRVLDALATITTLTATISLGSLVLVLVWQVFGRYVLNSSPTWTEPVALTLMSISALFGAAIGIRNEAHFNFPTLLESLAPSPRRVVKALSHLICFIIGAILAWDGLLLMLDGWDVPMAGAPLPEGVAFTGLVLGGALISIFSIERLVCGDAAKERA